MKQLIKLTGIAFLLVLTITACSKEKRYENKLTRKGGLWTISEYKHQVENDSTSYEIAQEYSGTIQFNENGSYEQKLIVDETTYTTIGQWDNSEYQLKLTPAGMPTIQLGFNSIDRKKIVVKTHDIDFFAYSYEFLAMNLTRKD